MILRMVGGLDHLMSVQGSYLPPCFAVALVRVGPQLYTYILFVLLCAGYIDQSFFCLFFRLTVIPGPPLFSLTVQLLGPFPCRVEFIKDIE